MCIVQHLPLEHSQHVSICLLDVAIVEELLRRSLRGSSLPESEVA